MHLCTYIHAHIFMHIYCRGMLRILKSQFHLRLATPVRISSPLLLPILSLPSPSLSLFPFPTLFAYNSESLLSLYLFVLSYRKKCSLIQRSPNLSPTYRQGNGVYLYICFHSHTFTYICIHSHTFVHIHMHLLTHT